MRRAMREREAQLEREMEARMQQQMQQQSQQMQLQIQQMQALQRQVQESQECSICMDRTRDCVLNCGHQLCMACARPPLQLCPFCKKTITSRTRTFA